MSAVYGLASFFLPATIGLTAFAVGLFLARKFADSTGPASPPVPQPEEDADDPTAPITPMIEIGHSPHDRHRDLSVGNALVKNIEMLESILENCSFRP